MKSSVWLTGLLTLGLVLSLGCTTMQTWPGYQRSAENEMVVIQESIGGGLEAGTLTPDQTQGFLARLKDIRSDYEALTNKRVYRGEWDNLHGKLNALSGDVRAAKTRPPQFEASANSERIIAIQGKIDDGRNNRRWSSIDEREFQSRLDSIRQDYLRMTEGGRSATYQERDDLARRLNVLDADLSRSR